MIPMWEIRKQQKTKLAELIEYAGNKSRLAKALGYSKQVVGHWEKRGRISATAAMIAEDVTNGYFKKEDLRPDVSEWNNKG